MSSLPSVPPESASPPRAAAFAPTAVVGLLVVVELVSGLIQGIVPTITPALGVRLDVDAASLGWVNSVFLLSSALWVPVMSKLGDLYGHRRLLRVSVVLLAAGSVLTAVAPNYAVFLVGRVLQGALLCFLPLEMALVRSRLSVEKARSGIAILIGALTLGGSLGLVAGGALLQWMGSVGSALWVPAIAAIACIAVPFFFVPESTTRAADGSRVDWVGALLLACGLGAVMLALAFGPKRGWNDVAVLVLLVGGIAVLVGWWQVELRRTHPLVAVRHLAQPKVLLLYAGAALVGMAIFGPQTVVATFAATPPASGYGFGLTGLSLGFFLLPLGAAAFVGSFIAPRIVPLWGQRGSVIAGFLVVATAFVAAVPLSGSVAGMIVALALVGLGAGVVISVLPSMILERLPGEEAGISAGVYNMVRTLGGSVIAAVFAAVLASATPVGSKLVAPGGYTTVWIICAAVALVGVAVTAVSGRDGHRRDR